MSWPWKANHHLKRWLSWGHTCQVPKTQLQQIAMGRYSQFHTERSAGERAVWRHILLFTPLVLASQTVWVRNILGNHLVHPPLILQGGGVFTCEKTEKWRNMPLTLTARKQVTWFPRHLAQSAAYSDEQARKQKTRDWRDGSWLCGSSRKPKFTSYHPPSVAQDCL